ncbi:MAG: hypothetical protein PHU85_03405, partial [Phycisphaerae bacterium]|nr:hypothetical protein [Phycisphaerae bacterium]
MPVGNGWRVAARERNSFVEGHAMNRILATVAMAATLIFAAVGSTSAALILPTPDGDTFSTAG